MSVNGAPGDPGVVDALGSLADQQEVRDAGAVAALRGQLAAWAAARPGHGVAGFGDEIEIVSVTKWRGFAFEGTTQVERRALVRRQQAHGGDAVDPSEPDVHDDVDVWQFDVALPDIHDAAEHVERIDGSDHIHACLTCDALSTITCENCDGLGLVPGMSIPKPGLSTEGANRAMESATKAMDGLVSGLFGKKS